MADVVQLIDSDSSGHYRLNPEGAQVLSEQPGPIGVVSVYGPYRTGKSLFINKCLLPDARTGFPVGNSVSACTKGICLYRHPAATKKGLPVFVLDVEGAFSLDAPDGHDSNLFALALLLSSFFVYNSVKSIDSSAIQHLDCVTRLAHQLLAGTENRNFFPRLLWLIRDFALNLEDTSGKPISPNQYLEDALTRLDQTRGEEAEGPSLLTRLDAAFAERSCRTLVRPCHTEADLRLLQDGAVDLMRPEFRSGLLELREFILDHVPPKSNPGFPGRPMKGPDLCALIEQCIGAINCRLIPKVSDLWSVMARQHELEQEKALVKEFQQRLQQCTDLDRVDGTIAVARLEALTRFRQVCGSGGEPSLVQSLDLVGRDYASGLAERCRDLAETRLQEVRRRFKEALEPASLSSECTELADELTRRHGRLAAVPVYQEHARLLRDHTGVQTTELHQLAASTQTAELRAAGLENRLQRAEDQVTLLTSTNQKLQERVDENLSHIQELTDQYEQFRQGLGTPASAPAAQVPEPVSPGTAPPDLTQIETELRSQISREFEKKFAEQAEENQELRAQLTERVQQIRAETAKTVGVLRQKLQDQVAQQAGVITEKDQERESIVEQLRQQLVEAQARCTEAERDAVTQRQENTDLLQRSSAGATEVRKLEARLEQQAQEHAAELQRLRDHHEGHLQRKDLELASQRAMADCDLAKQVTTIKRLQLQLDTSKRKIDQCFTQEEMARCTAETSKIRREAETLKMKTAWLETTSQRDRDSLQQSYKRVKTLEEHNRRLNEDLELASMRLEVLEGTFE